MRVFDLRCAHDHRFEGWFASGEAYDDQLARGLIGCPVCADTAITRLPSAPHLNLSAPQKTAAAGAAQSRDAEDEAHRDSRRGADPRAGNESRGQQSERDPREVSSGGSGSGSSINPAQAAELQALWLNTVREVLRKTENVGEGFAEEARRMHYKEAPERAIRGVASADQVAELADEGIDVMALPIPDALKEPLQ